jgi:pimeloyl-ACP methyl ester carboxylesterase
VIDNRGIGKSEAPSGPILIPDMAADAAAVLDAAGIESAFVFGLSMGGFIAQELALSHPRRVRALVLGGTTCGGDHAVRAEQVVQDTLVSRAALLPEESIRAMFPYIYDPTTPDERLEADVRVRLADYPDPKVYMGQLAGIQSWQGCDRLNGIDVPTMILHGENDRLVPPANARILARHIEGSRVCMIPDASHVFTTDAPDVVVHRLVEFLLDSPEQGCRQ